VEELKCNGKWTNCAADLLPLTLSNWSRETIKLQRKYKAKQAISLAKKKDLLSLCKSRVIPVEYHYFYKGLPANAKVNDTLPSPDAEEDEQDSDKE